MEFGKSLRAAREAKGYTVSQIAEMTHIKTAIVEGLENDDFSSIVAPIYGRGFVKLYCEAVGLEAKPFVDEFMEIMNGNRDIPIRERTAAAPATEAAGEPAVPETPPSPPPVPAERDLFAQDEAPATAVKPSAAAAEPKPDISRYASPFHSEDQTPAAVPVLPWRLILLGTAGLALLAILAFGVRALYRATSAEGKETPAAQSAEKPAEKQPAEKPAEKPAARARQQNIPSLYID